ncbi:hypothetical protein BCR44DRAFT_61083 [Catenaria anguillulae PL171]|uniref:Transmembrane protein n=1 Tax=Catenaria anguillulae PL171 TaxID=765915 RepID=A0A1Y2HMP3_9FUNG|nr:hypothetical protein BCR44DRAFT_61083 [Catenaria anguillulae PL171]
MPPSPTRSRINVNMIPTPPSRNRRRLQVGKLLATVLVTVIAFATLSLLTPAAHAQRRHSSPSHHVTTAKVQLNHDSDSGSFIHPHADSADSDAWWSLKNEKDDPLPHPRRPHRPHIPSPRPRDPISPPPPPPEHDNDPLPRHPKHPHDSIPTDPLDPPSVSPNPDLLPHYNLLLSSASRSLFLSPLIFLLLWGVHAITLWAGTAYHDRRMQLLSAHPEARYGPEYDRHRARNISSDHDQQRQAYGSTTAAGMAPAAEPDLTRREDAERVVAGLVQEVRQTRTVSRPATGSGSQDPQLEQQHQQSLGQRIESTTGLHLPSESDPLLGPTREPASSSAQVGIPHSLLDTAGADDELADPILTLFSEPDADWLTDSPDAYTRRTMLIQPSGVTAVKNAGQVAGMLFAMTLALAVLGTLGVFGMPQPTARDDAVGSRMRVLTLVGVSWGIVGVGIVWVLGEGMFLALHDLHRLRSLATLLLFAMMLVFGATLEAENRARLHEMDRIHRPEMPDIGAPPGFPTPDKPSVPSPLNVAASVLSAPALGGMGWI